MAPRRLWLRARELAVHWTGRIFIFGLFAAAAIAVVLATAVHHTAQPEFCNSCHIMEPYYASWQASSHRDVGCIECHYEPGSVETLEGKFKALSQLSKYITRTQGTKPWAEVSDLSCERSGCHSTRLLEGPVAFGNVNFDHRQHLLESRRGRRLRCTSCHSQNELGVHMSVAKSVCFTCHFMPDEHGETPQETSDCMLCHGPPKDQILVDGKPFDHGEYVERGVDCRECHDPVIEGSGVVRKERCHSCHGEAGHIERIGETAFLHETHVTAHKVECFECHDEIHHGLLPIQPIAPAAGEGCGSCHANSHDSARQLYAGQGAVGVPDAPSRMHQTRVVCEACHTGRSGFTSPDSHDSQGHEALAFAGSDGRAVAHGSSVASAGNVDCIHCHGTGFDGMLDEWQASVGEQLERLRPALAELRPLVGSQPSHPAFAPLREAERNFALVALDGSKGAHNVAYALDVLRAAAERLDRVRELVGEPQLPALASGMPFRSEQGCTTCHSAAGRPPEVSREERVFPHAKHLASGLDCNACHSLEQHGQPSFPRSQCASCHHQESETRDVGDCASCHAPQEAMLRGTVALLPEPKPGTMSQMECGECHGEAPKILRPKPQMCVMCHEDGYDDLQRTWQAEIGASLARLETALAEARSRGNEREIVRARELYEAVAADGSVGAHNFELAKFLLEEAGKALAGQ